MGGMRIPPIFYYFASLYIFENTLHFNTLIFYYTMASIGGGSSQSASVHDPKANYTAPLILMVSLFFMIGFITVLNDVLIPSLKGVFDLKAWQAMLIQFCFFGAYFVMSYPAGALIEKVGYKKGLIIALSVMGTGLLMF